MKIRHFILTCIMLSLVLSCLPINTYAAASFVFEPYSNITRMASGRSAYKFVERLTREDMAGRQSGTEGCDKAALWIADQFKSFGLQPYKGDSYLQSLPVSCFNLVPPLQVQYSSMNRWITSSYREEFIVFPYSGQGKISNDSVFVGYGIQAPELQYDEYENMDVTNKTVLFFWDLPGFFKGKEDQFSYYQRINTAYAKGASSVVLLLKEGVDSPVRFDMKMSVGYDAHIPVILANQALSYAFMKASDLDLNEISKKMEMNQKPLSTVLSSEFHIEVHYQYDIRNSSNVIGYIPAIDPNEKGSILITSHYDALGIDHVQNTIYHGANDNASSTGCIMEVARNLLQNRCLPSVNLVFIAFTGEEEGLLGSYYYVKHPLFPLGKIKAVLNSEEIGTFNGVNIAGTSRSIYPELSKLITSSAKFLKFDVSIITSLLYPGSDHWPFHEQEIPAVCFARLPLPNGYPEYHKLSDTIEIISPDSLEIYCHLITLMVLSYSNASFINTNSFPVQSQSVHPFITIQSDCYFPANTPLSFYINGKKLDLPVSDKLIEELSLFIPLKAGNNEVLFEIRHQHNSHLTQSFSIACDPDPKLRADFNRDFRVDFNDLALFTQKLDTLSPSYCYDSLYDLDQDERITLADYAFFTTSFGYHR